MTRVRRAALVLFGIGLTLGLAGPAAAQAPGAGGGQSGGEDGIDLVYEREVFLYSVATRRDPFRPLTSDGGVGPQIDQLRLRGIIYSPDGGVALLVDARGDNHRLRVGDIVGNARVLEIRPLQVRFAVESFGMVQQRVLELRRTGSEGAER